MICQIGFMQGRLCDPINGLIQAFPFKDCEKEFELAESIRINLMEWTLDSDGLKKESFINRHGSEKGARALKET